MKRAHPEQELHRAVAEFLSWALAPPAWWTTIPAGGGGKIRGAILKAMGYKAGTPDILIVYDGRAYWPELKTDRGRLSKAQIETHAALRAAGCHVAVCRSLHDVQALFGPTGPWWPIPVRFITPNEPLLQPVQTRIGRRAVS